MTHNNTTESTLHTPHYLSFQPVKYHYACHRKQKKRLRIPETANKKREKLFVRNLFRKFATA